MDPITQNDLQRLRSLAHRKLEFAHCENNERILRQYRSLAEKRRDTPTVRMLWSNFPHEVVENRLLCETEAGRNLERRLLSSMVGRELFDDDTPITPTFDITAHTGIQVFGQTPQITFVPGSTAHHIHPVIEDLEEEFEKLKGGHFYYDREKTREDLAFAQDVLGDLLEVRLVQRCLTAPLTYPLVSLMTMENFYLSMYDCPETLHAALELATRMYESYFDFLEAEKLLLPTCDNAPLAAESFCYNTELPRDKAESTRDYWLFLESQETTSVSPETFGEFVYPYQSRLLERFGLLSYGCCERVDALWENYLSKWDKLRKLSVSPFNNEPQVGEYLRGTNVVYYSKPRAEFVTNPGPLDVEALRENFGMVCRSASGCLFEVAQREVGTIFGDYNRGKEYVRILRQCIEDFWQP